MINIQEQCRHASAIGIGGHVRPDGDCVGSCMSLYLYLKKVFPDKIITVFLEEPAEIFRCIKGIEEVNSTFSSDTAYDVFFVLDCVYERLGEAQKFFDAAAKTINIDHHISNRTGCADLNYIVPETGSTSELIYDLMDKKIIDQEIAQAVYIGMAHDTGVFQYSSTTPGTMRKAAELMEYGFDFSKIIEETFYQKTYIQNQILGRALLESIIFMDGKCIVSFINKKTMDFYHAQPKDLDGIVNQLRYTKGVDCAIFIYETGFQEYKVSMRSNERVNVSEIASYFGGGGHVRAAGCTMQGTVHDVINNLSGHIEKQIGESL